jgi:hypothetical protein
MTEDLEIIVSIEKIPLNTEINNKLYGQIDAYATGERLSKENLPGNYPKDRLQLLESKDNNVNLLIEKDFYFATFDIRGFTNFLSSIPVSEDITFKRALIFIESFFNEASDTINESNGIINKYLGDAVFC